MSISHHPSDASILAYASGALASGFSLLLDAHLAMCPVCRERVRMAEMMGGACMEELPEAALSSGSLATVLQRLDTVEPLPAQATAPAVCSDLPAPLAAYVDARMDALPWRKLVPGIRHIPLRGPGLRDETVRMLKVSPGTSLPHHTHRGLEFTLVLRGSFSDEFGRFAAGDFADLDQEADHQPIADADEDCICIIATDAPLAFHGIVPRLLQPLLGL